MKPGTNSQEAELKAKRRSLIGKIKRRDGTIAILNSERRSYAEEVRAIDLKLDEYRVKR